MDMKSKGSLITGSFDEILPKIVLSTLGECDDAAEVIDIINCVERAHVTAVIYFIGKVLKVKTDTEDETQEKVDATAGFIKMCKDDFNNNLDKIIGEFCKDFGVPDPLAVNPNAELVKEILELADKQ